MTEDVVEHILHLLKPILESSLGSFFDAARMPAGTPALGDLEATITGFSGGMKDISIGKISGSVSFPGFSSSARRRARTRRSAVRKAQSESLALRNSFTGPSYDVASAGLFTDPPMDVDVGEHHCAPHNIDHWVDPTLLLSSLRSEAIPFVPVTSLRVEEDSEPSDSCLGGESPRAQSSINMHVNDNDNDDKSSNHRSDPEEVVNILPAQVEPVLDPVLVEPEKVMPGILAAVSAYDFLEAHRLLRVNSLNLNLADILPVCINGFDQEIAEGTEKLRSNRLELKALKDDVAKHRREVSLGFEEERSDRTMLGDRLRECESMAADCLRFETKFEAENVRIKEVIAYKMKIRRLLGIIAEAFRNDELSNIANLQSDLQELASEAKVHGSLANA